MANKASKTDITQKQAEQVAVEVAKKNNPYRDENGVRIQTYKRFKEGIDYLPMETDDMSAMIGLIQKGNNTRMGRPPKYEDIEEFQGAIQAFWDYCHQSNANGVALIPDVEGLCCYLGIDRVTLGDWERTRSAEFSSTIKSTKNAIAFCKKQLALRGKIPPIVFATDFNNNHGYTQKQEIAVSVPQQQSDDPATLVQAAKMLPDGNGGKE